MYADAVSLSFRHRDLAFGGLGSARDKIFHLSFGFAGNALGLGLGVLDDLLRLALRAIESNVGWTSDGEPEMTRRISLAAAFCPCVSVNACARRALLALSSWRDRRRAST